MSGRISELLGINRVPPVGWLLGMQTLVTELGFFTMFPILALLLGQTHGLPLHNVALPVAVFTVAIRGSFLVAPLMVRGRLQYWMLSGLCMSSISFVIIFMVNSRQAVVLLLGAAGLGISLYLTASRAHIAAEVNEPRARMETYSVLNLGLNLSASVGPIIGGYLLSHQLARLVYLLIAAGYAGAACSIILFWAPYSTGTAHERGKLPRVLDLVALILRNREFRRLAVVSALGWCVYAQLFATLPLQFVHAVGESYAIGTLFVINALMVVLFQLPLSALVNRTIGLRYFTLESLLALGFCFFAAAFVLIATGGSSYLAILVAVALFTFGELIFVPISNTLVAAIGDERHHVLFFAARGMLDAAGEGIGVYIGIRALTALHESATGGDQVYWLALTMIAVTAAVLARFTLHVEDRQKPIPLDSAP